MRILVTGGCGVVGSQFAASAKEEGHEITVIDACEERRNLWLASLLQEHGVDVVRMRLESSKALDWLFDHFGNFDLVLHAAAFTGIPASMHASFDDWASNVDATLSILRTAIDHGSEKCPKIVVLSSVKPYDLSSRAADVVEGESSATWDPKWGVNENFPLDPDEPYAASKMAQSAACVAYARTFDLPITVFRCSNLYGPAPCHGPRHGWLTWFCIQAALGDPIRIQGSGKQTRDMLHTRDVKEAVFAAARNMEKCRGQLFNVGGGFRNSMSVLNAATLLSQRSGVEIAYEGHGRRFEDMVFITDHSKFTNATGWVPAIDVQSGLNSVYEWALDNRDELRRIYFDGR